MRIVVALAIAICVAGFAPAQEDTAPQKRLRPPAKSSGFVGGEAHDSHVIRAEKGQTLSVQTSWQHDGGVALSLPPSRKGRVAISRLAFQVANLFQRFAVVRRRLQGGAGDVRVAGP